MLKCRFWGLQCRALLWIIRAYRDRKAHTIGDKTMTYRFFRAAPVRFGYTSVQETMQFSVHTVPLGEVFSLCSAQFQQRGTVSVPENGSDVFSFGSGLGTEKNIYHHHPESKKRKSSKANSGSIHPYGRHGNAVKTRKTLSIIAILWPVKAIFEKRAATVEVDTFIFPAGEKRFRRFWFLVRFLSLPSCFSLCFGEFVVFGN